MLQKYLRSKFGSGLKSFLYNSTEPNLTKKCMAISIECL